MPHKYFIVEVISKELLKKENWHLAAGYVDGVCISNDEYYPPTIYFDKGETARKALEGEELKTLCTERRIQSYVE